MTKAGERLINAAQSALDEFRREGGKPLEQMEAEMTNTPNKIEEIRAALEGYEKTEVYGPLIPLAPDMARIVLAAEAAIASSEVIARRLSHIVGKEMILDDWEAKRAAYRATEGGE